MLRYLDDLDSTVARWELLCKSGHGAARKVVRSARTLSCALEAGSVAGVGKEAEKFDKIPFSSEQITILSRDAQEICLDPLFAVAVGRCCAMKYAFTLLA